MQEIVRILPFTLGIAVRLMLILGGSILVADNWNRQEGGSLLILAGGVLLFFCGLMLLAKYIKPIIRSGLIRNADYIEFTPRPIMNTRVSNSCLIDNVTGLP